MILRGFCFLGVLVIRNEVEYFEVEMGLGFKSLVLVSGKSCRKIILRVLLFGQLKV